jgi:molecular chaperone DnaK (HSP70)
MFVERFADDCRRAAGEGSALMALLQISEPGASPDPHQRRYAVGIDLGTTHSLVAAVRSGVAECLPDDQGEVILPSAVRYLEGGRAIVGARALEASASDPHNTIVSVKRLMGRGLSDVARAGPLPYDFEDSGAGMVRVRTVAGVKSPVEISAEILATLRQRAEDTFADDLFGAVVTVPGLFRRRAAPGDQGRRGAGRAEGAASCQRANGRGHRLRARQRRRGALCRATTSAAAPSTSPSCA